MCFPPKYLTTQRNRHARLTHWSFLYLITSHIYSIRLRVSGSTSRMSTSPTWLSLMFLSSIASNTEDLDKRLADVFQSSSIVSSYFLGKGKGVPLICGFFSAKIWPIKLKGDGVTPK